MKLERGKVKEKIKTKWHQKYENTGIFCNRRSDVDEGTKKNLITNMERKIERLTSEEEDIERTIMGAVKNKWVWSREKIKKERIKEKEEERKKEKTKKTCGME